MCRKLTIAEVIEHAVTRNQRGGSWNYKIAIHTGMTLSEDLKGTAISALETLVVMPEATSTLAQLALGDERATSVSRRPLQPTTALVGQGQPHSHQLSPQMLHVMGAAPGHGSTWW
jgi:hypothetical protein